VTTDSARVNRILQSDDLLDALAAVEHERWAHWQQYVHDQCTPGADGSLTIPPELVRRWSLQIRQPYSSLTEEEKESDREQVQRYLPVIADALTRR
jgi:hypothetical protein